MWGECNHHYTIPASPVRIPRLFLSCWRKANVHKTECRIVVLRSNSEQRIHINVKAVKKTWRNSCCFMIRFLFHYVKLTLCHFMLTPRNTASPLVTMLGLWEVGHGFQIGLIARNPVQRISFENKMDAMTRKRAISSVKYRDLHMLSSSKLLSSVVLLLYCIRIYFSPTRD